MHRKRPLVKVRNDLPKVAVSTLEDHVIWLVSSDVLCWLAAMNPPTDVVEGGEPDGSMEDPLVPFGWGLDPI